MILNQLKFGGFPALTIVTYPCPPPMTCTAVNPAPAFFSLTSFFGIPQNDIPMLSTRNRGCLGASMASADLPSFGNFESLICEVPSGLERYSLASGRYSLISSLYLVLSSPPSNHP